MRYKWIIFLLVFCVVGSLCGAADIGTAGAVFGASGVWDGSVKIYRNGNDLYFVDVTNPTPKTLSQLLSTDHAAVTLASPNRYLSLSGQQITPGVVAVADGGTGLTAVGTAGQLFGTNATANGFGHLPMNILSSGATYSPTLSAASGTEYAFNLAYTTNKAAGDDYGLRIVQTDTNSPGTSYLLYASSGAQFVSIQNNGWVFASGRFASNSGFSSQADNNTASVQHRNFSAADNAVEMASGTFSNTSGDSAAVKIMPTYNQASGTAANTDLLINRTETAVGSGVQRLLDAQVGGASKFSVSNLGMVRGTVLPMSAGYNASAVMTDTVYFKMSDGVVMSATRGRVMSRPGSIVRVSGSFDLTAASGGASTYGWFVSKAGTGSVWSASLDTTVAGGKTFYAEQNPGTDAFVAGDVISWGFGESGANSYTIDEAEMTVEVIYN